jgi:hypothetical protein
MIENKEFFFVSNKLIKITTTYHNERDISHILELHPDLCNNIIDRECFIKSLLDTKILDSGIADENYKTITFSARSVKPLKEFLNLKKECITPIEYNLWIHMLWSLEKQQDYLNKNYCGFYKLHLDDIIVINETFFICVNPKLIMNIIKGKFRFYSPFDRSGFVSPEIANLTFVPAEISIKTFYYSLGALTLYCMYDYNVCDGSLKEIDKTQMVYKKIVELTKDIQFTKLYWSLMRSLCVESDKRVLLFV